MRETTDIEISRPTDGHYWPNAGLDAPWTKEHQGRQIKASVRHVRSEKEARRIQKRKPDSDTKGEATPSCRKKMKVVKKKV